MQTTTSTQWLTPREIADELRVDVGKVLVWINTGELVAVDHTESRGKRPRWRISRAEFDAFLLRRQSPAAKPATEQPPRRRQRGRAEDIKFV